MAIDLATARRAAQERNERPPGGEQPGTPEYDNWAMAWFQAGLDAGDPDLTRRAGGQEVEGGGDLGVMEGQGAPTAEWFGKRKPTPSELVRYYRETGKSEDFKRFSGRQVAKWITDKWDVAGGYFTNDYGDIVEKPSEDGPNSRGRQALFNTGKYGSDPNAVQGGGGGGSGLGGARTAAPASTDPDPTDYFDPDNPLQARLMQLFETGGGYFGDVKDRAGQFLKGGGLVWKDRNEEGGLPPAPGTDNKVSPPSPVTSPGVGVGAVPGAAQPNPALVAATLNAFSPAAPSQQRSGFAPQPATKPVPAQPQTPAPVQPVQPQAVTPSPTTRTSPLSQALSQRYLKPNAWWAGGNSNYQY